MTRATIRVARHVTRTATRTATARRERRRAGHTTTRRANRSEKPTTRSAALRALLCTVLVVFVGGLAACSAGGPRHHLDGRRLGPYSGAVEAGGFVLLSGKVGAERGGRFADEVHSALDAVEAELAGSGLALADLLAVTVYLTDMQLYAEFNAIYAARVPEPWPARTCVAVAALPGGARVEIQSVAWRRP